MSTINDPRVEPSPAPGSAADPFRYGWRYVARKQPDGGVELEQAPLTLEDLLFPEEGDFAVQYRSHIEDCFYLLGVFQNRLAGRPGSLVLSDCRVRWDVPGLRPLGPDVAVFLDAPDHWDGGTLGVAEVEARPVLVVEVTSPETRKKDFGVKKGFYHRAGVPLYVIVDARPGPKGRRVKLHGFRHDPEGYTPLLLDEHGRLWLEPMGLWLAVADRRVVCIDGETGEPIGGYGEQVQARIEAEARSQADLRARTEAEAHAARIEARLDDLARVVDDFSRIRQTQAQQIEALVRIASDLQAQVDAESRLAKAQTRIAELHEEIRDVFEARAETAEARIAELEAENRKLRGEG